MNHIFFCYSLLLLLSLSVACDNSNSPAIDSTRGPALFSYSAIDIEPTQFVIDNTRDTLLFGKSGLILYVPAQSFVLRKKGTPVEILLKEYNKPSEILTQRISNTSADQELLRSNHILHIQAKQGSQDVPLAPRHDLRIHVQCNKKDPHDDSITLWRGEPTAWSPLKYDRPKLFSHVLRIGKHKDLAFQDGSSVKAWEKANLSFTKEEEIRIWDYQKYLYLYYTITKTGEITNVSFKEEVDPEFEAKILKNMKDHPKCMPYIENGKAVDIKCQYDFHVHEAEPKYRNDLHYLDILKGNYPELKRKKITHIDNLELKYHIFNIGRLGWIATAHAEKPKKTVNLNVKLAASFATEVKVFLKKSKVILSGIRQGNEVNFPLIPDNEPIEIVAFGEKNKQPQMASLKANSSDGIINLNLSPSSYDAIKEALQKLN